MTRTQVTERRAALRSEVATLGRPGADGTVPPDVEARMTAIEREAEELDAEERRLDLQDRLDRASPGRPAGGGAPAREVRVFQGAASTVPAAFDGTMLRTQGGDVVPVLDQRHQLASFVPQQPESRATELGFGGLMRTVWRGPETELERRVMAEASVGAGGILVPPAISAQVIDAMRARSVAFRAGVGTIPMTTATLRLARMVELPQGGWRAENAPIAYGDPTFDGITLEAHTWALRTNVSRELLEDATNLDAVMRGAFAASAAIALDRAILFGTGANDEPRGITNDPDVNVVSMGTNGGTFSSYGPFLDAALALDVANAGDITGVIYAPRTRRALDGMADGDGNPLVVPRRFADVPQLVTTAVPVNQTQGTATNASPIILGDFTKVLVGMRTSLQISILTERYAENGQVAFIGWLRADLAVIQPKALAVITGVKPA